MRLSTEQIDDTGIELSLAQGPEAFPVLDEIRVQDGVEFDTPIHFELRIVRIEDVIDVRGRFHAEVHLHCSRCLSAYRTGVEGQFQLTYIPRLQMPEQRRPGEETELAADEIGLIPFDGDELDLTEGLQENLVMALPPKPLCDPDCRGICPGCGVDLNQNPCTCSGPEVDPRLAPLAGLKLK